MSDPSPAGRVRRAAEPSGLETSASSTGTRVPADVVRRAHGRLAVASLMLAGAFLFAFPIMNFAPPATEGSLALANVVAAVSVVAALAVFGLTRLKIDPERLLDYALVFEVVVGFGAAFAETFATYDADAPVRGVSWLCLLIVLFPLIVPSTPGKTLVAALATATMTPIALVLIIALGAPAPPGVNFIYLTLPNYFAAGIAVICSRIINRLTSDVERAREMGSYELVEPLGKGGMGEVWRARHRMLARPAAIKLVSAQVLAGRADTDVATLERRFEREAQSTASLTSPHTIQLFDFGVTDDGTLYYVMELLEGIDTQTLVDRYGPLPPARAVHVLLQVCESLAEAHAAGLVHRDVKPANIYLCKQGTHYDHVKVLDFGLVAEQAMEQEATRLTKDGTVTGTPAFMAPEMITGDREIDNRTDLYSLGCVAYFLLTGELVFTGSPVQVVYGHVEKEPEPPSAKTQAAIPDDLEAVVMACLSKEPGARPIDAQDLARRLDACQVDRWTPTNAESWWSDHADAAKGLGPSPGTAGHQADSEALAT